MQVSTIKRSIFLLAIGLVVADAAQAFGFGNMMSPSRWMGGDNDRNDEAYYDAPPYGYGYPGGYAAPGYAQPGYAAPGYTAPGYGYGAPAYPAPAATPAYQAPVVTPVYPAPVVIAPVPPVAAPPVVAAPAPAASAPAAAKPPPVMTADEAEIARLQKRIRELEAAGETPDYTVPTDAGAAGSATATTIPNDSRYNMEYSFPASDAGASVPPRADKAQQEYPVYSPFGPPAEFPPLEPDAEPVAPAPVKAVAVPVKAVAAPEPEPAATAMPAAPADVDVTAEPVTAPEPAAPAGGVVNFTPGNPAAYVPPMQDTGQRVYELGR